MVSLLGTINLLLTQLVISNILLLTLLVISDILLTQLLLVIALLSLLAIWFRLLILGSLLSGLNISKISR